MDLSDFNLFDVEPEPENAPEPEPEVADGESDAVDSPEAEEPVMDSDSSDIVDVPAGDSVGPALTDEDIERIFGQISAKAKEDEEILRSAQIVLEAEAALAEAEVSMEKSKSELDALDEEIRAMERALTEKKRARSEVSNSLWDVRAALNQSRRNADEAKKAAHTAKENLDAAYEMELLSDEMEKRAKMFDWYNGIGEDKRKILPHQWDAIRFMVAGKRVILGDEMGLGKTLSAIASVDVADSKRILIIAPADITGNFLEEVQYWANHRPVINIKGESKVVRQQMIDLMVNHFESFIVVVNYEAWRKDHNLIVQMINVGFDTVIADEAHTMKETDTNAYRGVSEIVHAVNFCPNCKTNKEYGVPCVTCAWNGQSYERDYDIPYSVSYWDTRSVKNVFLMTGTAILNKPADLFSLLSIIDPVIFNNKNEYLRQYAEFDVDRQQWVFQYGGVGRLIRRLSGKYLSRNLQDAGIILPPQKPIVHQVALDEERHAGQIAVIEQISKHAEIVLDENRQVSIAAIIAIITRQRQAAVWPGGITIYEPKILFDDNGMPYPNPKAGEILWRVSEEVQDSVKMDKAVELVKEFTAAGQRIVIFSQFSTALQELHSRINLSQNDEGGLISSVVFDGSTPQDVRQEVRRNFDRKNDEPKKWDVVLANYKTGGTGLNLTAATHTIILDREWNPGKENQALARTHRIGQTDTTFVHIIEIPNSIDEWMNEIINKKAEMIGGFTEGADTLRDDLLKKLRGRNKK